MSNPNNETSEYNFPPQRGGHPQGAQPYGAGQARGAQQHNGNPYGGGHAQSQAGYPQGQAGQPHAGQGWGQAQNHPGNQYPGNQYTGNQAGQGWNNGAPKQKKKHKGLRILLSIVVVLVLLIALAEFGMRAYLKDQIANGVKEQAAESGVELASEPKANFGKSSVLLGMLTQNIGELNMEVPSSLDISYEDGDKSRPVVNGNPEVKFEGRDVKIENQGEQMIVGELTMNTSIPSELMLAQVAKSTAQQGGSGGGMEGLVTITGVKPNEEDQTLEFEITHGLATMKMKPVVENGKMRFDVEGAQLFGMDLPESLKNSVQDSLSQDAVGMEDTNLEFKNVHVTSEGMDVEMYGRNVDMKEMSQSIEKTPGESSSGGSLNPGAGREDEGPVGSSGDGYGSSLGAAAA